MPNQPTHSTHIPQELGIGELSKQSGIPVKTIRFYADAGILVPLRTSATGYRIFAPEDVGKLSLIRLLRELDFSLKEIRTLLENETTLQTSLKAQLERLELERRAFARRTAIVRATLNANEPSLALLQRLTMCARLDTFERKLLLGVHVDQGLQTVPIDETWKAGYLHAVLDDLPSALENEQLEAWLELAALITDESFWHNLAVEAQPFWEQAKAFEFSVWEKESSRLYREAAEAVSANEPPTGDRGLRLAQALVALYAQTLQREPNKEFIEWMLQALTQQHEPRAERFWELVSILRGWEDKNRSSAHNWLVLALRAHTPTPNPA